MHEEIVDALTTAHRMMTHVLTLIRVQVEMLFPEADASQFEFLGKAIGYMNKYPGVVHHPVEEIVFERLLGYAPELQPVCANLTNQHNTFKVDEAAILGHIPRARNGDGEACRQIKALGLEYCIDHIGHIDDEEGQVLPEAVRRLRADDWRAIGASANFALDPLSDPKTLARCDNLYDFIMAMDTSATRH